MARLVEQGLVRATEVGRTRVHELNRDHVAASVAVSLAGLRLELWKRMRDVLGRWKVRPVYASAFGSAARCDGGPGSDIDVVLVHPPFPGDKRLGRSSGLKDVLGKLAVDVAGPGGTDADALRWSRQVDELHVSVRKWTGNPLQVVDLSVYEWADRNRGTAALLGDVDRDAVVLIQPGAVAAMAGKRSRGDLVAPSALVSLRNDRSEVRVRTADAYLEVAELVLDEHQRDEYLSVAAGLAVLAGIAASDAICCARLGRRHRGDDHRGAAELLSGAVPDGKRWRPPCCDCWT